MWGGVLLAALSPALAAQALCEDIRASGRQYADQLEDDVALHADAGQVDLKAYGVSRLSGGVRLRHEREILLAQDVEYNQARRHLNVQGQTYFETDALQVQAQSADIHLERNTAQFRDAEYATYAANARGRAGLLSITGPGQATLSEVRYTTCPQGAEDWVIEADEIHLNSVRGQGSARNARLRFMGLPLFWLPAFYFPLGDQRTTGFLPPRIGDSGNTGIDISVPMYVNLAPNYDLTLTPRFMGDRGGQVTTQLRYLMPHGQAQGRYELLSTDRKTNQQRYLLAADLAGGTAPGWSWQGEFLRVSDVRYLTDLGSPVADPAQSQLPQSASLSYRRPGTGLKASLGVQDYQSLIASSLPEDQAYARLPELRLAWQPTYRNAQVRPALQLHSTNFRRQDTLEAWRHDAQLGLDWRYDIPQAFATAHADYRWTAYQLREPDGSRQQLDRRLPSVQAGFGLRLLRHGEGGNYQTLTPQVNYLLVPHRDQDAIPIFDTSQPDFSFDQLFAYNRFTGPDRIADANLVTTALRSDWFSNRGQTRQLSAKLGVQWRIEDSRVRLPGGQPQKSGSSDWLGELDYALNARLRVQLVGQWNAAENQMDQTAIAARYQRSPLSFAQLSYRFRRGNFEQTDALLALPVSARWRVAGRWTYSVQDHRSLEALGGVEYRSCCWGMQMAWRRYLTGDGGDFNSSLYLQLELNGLGRIGEGLDRLLDRDIL